MAPGLSARFYVALAPYLLLIIESLLVIAVLTLTFLFHRDAPRTRKFPVFLAWQSSFSRLARRKMLAAIVVGVGTLGIRVALLPAWGVPEPAWHDEFSYLLAADTFAHGKVTNHPHPMWIHFESFHIIQQPTYMSMYPPGQGLILAAGQVLGHPWIGQLLITALMCSCLCWMLQAWVPPPWALLGACLAALRLGLLSYWVNSYFGTALPALGGILVLGALPRIRRHARFIDALLMGLGLAILANTRPYEGFVYSLPVAGALLIWMAMQRRIPVSLVLRRVLLPLILLLGATGAAMGWYFWRVTGDAFVMPYQVNRQTYAVAPYFIWQKPRPEPVYHHAEMRRFYVDWELGSFESGRSLTGFARRMAIRFGTLWQFYVGPVFTLPLLALPLLFHDRRMKLPLIVAAAVLLGNVIETWTLVHYLAPALGLFFLLLVQCMRHLRLMRWRGRPVGQALARAVPLVCLAMVVLRVSAAATGLPIEALRGAEDSNRHTVESKLQAMPGKQLVIVHCGPEHIPHSEWVYNRADIDGAKIVWARDMGQMGNQELLRYFKDRQVWLINADDRPVKLAAYGSNNHQD